MGYERYLVVHSILLTVYFVVRNGFSTKKSPTNKISDGQFVMIGIFKKVYSSSLDL